MYSRFTRLIAVSALTLSLFGTAGMAQASSLSSTQISAIISLLQSFGADQVTINNVSAALGGQTRSNLWCNNFSDISYGTSDKTPGGPVSQLQAWLGISSNTFGFGTYGPKTKALWDSRCNQAQSISNFSANPTSGSTPLPVTFTYSFDANTVGTNGEKFMVDFGDGTSCLMTATITHTYTTPGIYTASISHTNNVENIFSYYPIQDASGNRLLQTIAVTGSNLGTPPATTQQLQSITTLLQSFGASSGTIKDVQNVLNGQTVSTPAPQSLTAIQFGSLIDVLHKLCINQLTISNIGNVLGYTSSK